MFDELAEQEANRAREAAQRKPSAGRNTYCLHSCRRQNKHGMSPHVILNSLRRTDRVNNPKCLLCEFVVAAAVASADVVVVAAVAAVASCRVPLLRLPYADANADADAMHVDAVVLLVDD